MLTELWAPGLLGNLSYSRKLTAARKEWIAKHFTWEEKCNTFYIWKIEITLLFYCLFHLWITNNNKKGKEKNHFFFCKVFWTYRYILNFTKIKCLHSERRHIIFENQELENAFSSTVKAASAPLSLCVNLSATDG